MGFDQSCDGRETSQGDSENQVNGSSIDTDLHENFAWVGFLRFVGNISLEKVLWYSIQKFSSQRKMIVVKENKYL